MRALLDVNVLVALLDRSHSAHSAARTWLLAHIDQGWASCPVTENGCARVLSLASYPNAISTPDALELVASACSTPEHAFWPDDVSLCDDRVAHRLRLHGGRQVTDVYLLALAVRNGGRFVTLDQRVPLNADVGATSEHLVVL